MFAISLAIPRPSRSPLHLQAQASFVSVISKKIARILPDQEESKPESSIGSNPIQYTRHIHHPPPHRPSQNQHRPIQWNPFLKIATLQQKRSMNVSSVAMDSLNNAPMKTSSSFVFQV